MPTTMNVADVIPGWQGELYYNGEFLAEVEGFSIKIIPDTTTVHPMGQAMNKSAITGFSVKLQFSAIKIKNTMTLAVINSIKVGSAGLDFMGKINSAKVTDAVNLRKCIPDGDVTIMDCKVNDIMKDDYSFTVNEYPDIF